MIQAGEPGHRIPLTRERILNAALELIDNDGLEAFTMRKLGAHLEVDPMAVYRHLPNKGAVLDGIVTELWSRGLRMDDIDFSDGWRTGIATAMRGMREELLAHPRAVTLVATHPLASTSEQYDFLERALELLAGAGLNPGPDVLALLNVVGVYTIGYVLAEAAEPAGGAGGEVDPEQFFVFAENYPHLARLLAEASTDRADSDAQYERGLAAILTGWPEPVITG